jgi:hypothetical protein
MRRRAGSFSSVRRLPKDRDAMRACALAAAFLLLGLACATDRSAVFDPIEEDLVLVPPVLGERDLLPAVSRDANVISWVRRSLTRDVVFRWERASSPESLLVLPPMTASLDLTGEGDRILAYAADTLRIWTRGESATRSYPVPAGFLNVTTMRWLDEDRILLGALGPEGQGLWAWDLEADDIAPLCTRFPDEEQDWDGVSPGIDRQGRRLCMQRATNNRRIWIGERATCETLLELDGTSPAFWTIHAEEEDGLLYLDPSSNLVAQRFRTQERFFVMPSLYEFDVSTDGRWIFVVAARPEGSRLILRDLRSFRD